MGKVRTGRRHKPKVAYNFLKEPKNNANNVIKMLKKASEEKSEALRAKHGAGTSKEENIKKKPYMIDWSQVTIGAVFDSHCHLDMMKTRRMSTPQDHGGLLGETGQDMGELFGGCIANFCDPRGWAMGREGLAVSQTVKEASRDDKAFISFGCHPHFADRMAYRQWVQLERLLRGQAMSVVSVGECGLDYSVKNKVDKELQKQVFHDQLLLALKYNLPLVLHIRDAEDDGYRVLEHAGVPADWIIHRHCFTGDWATASTWLDRFPASKIGITGCVTFSSATQVHETVRNMPVDRLLLETDAPYFLPVGVDKSEIPFSQPGHVLHVAAKVAELKVIALEEVLTATRRNVTEIYGVKIKDPVKSIMTSVVKKVKMMENPVDEEVLHLFNHCKTVGDKEVLVDAFNIKIHGADIKKVVFDKWLNDEVVNFFMELVTSGAGGSVHSFSSHFYPKLVKGGHQEVSRWTKKVDIFSYSIIFIPVHLVNHWCLATIDMTSNKLVYCDSMKDESTNFADGRKCLALLAKYLQKEHLLKKKVSLLLPPSSYLLPPS